MLKWVKVNALHVCCISREAHVHCRIMHCGIGNFIRTYHHIKSAVWIPGQATKLWAPIGSMLQLQPLHRSLLSCLGESRQTEPFPNLSPENSLQRDEHMALPATALLSWTLQSAWQNCCGNAGAHTAKACLFKLEAPWSDLAVDRHREGGKYYSEFIMVKRMLAFIYAVIVLSSSKATYLQ
jgi:hypothetical protein